MNRLAQLRRRIGITERPHSNDTGPTMPRHEVTRIRREVRRRTLTLQTIEKLTPRMLRLGFASPDLGDFASSSHDDHIKLFFPTADAEAGAKPCMRDFTPRRFDTDRGMLAIDFALHESGPATQWAMSAKIGDTLEIGGPRGSTIVQDDFDWYLLIGDETALPAIGRRVEELRAGASVATVVVVADAGEAQTFDTKAAWTPHWVAREQSSDDAALIRAVLADYPLPPGEGFVWIAAEGSVARSIRTYILEERGHPREWTKAAGYWKRGEADAHERIEE